MAVLSRLGVIASYTMIPTASRVAKRGCPKNGMQGIVSSIFALCLPPGVVPLAGAIAVMYDREESTAPATQLDSNREVLKTS